LPVILAVIKKWQLFGMGRKIVLVGAATAGAAACAVLVMDAFGQGPAQASYWAAILAAVAGVAAVPAAVMALLPQPTRIPLPPELQVPAWVIERPAELNAVVESLVSGTRTVGITTGLHGAGGFGKTTLAQIACADRRVRQRFGGRVFLITVGRDLRGPATISAKINDVIKLVTGEDATFTDPELAGRRLGTLLDAGPRRLLVLDDVWDPEQLAPFAQGGKRCSRLVTTRVPELLAGRGAAVKVDQMSPEQARALMTAGLPRIDPDVVESLLAVTGRWPLLLRLVSKILADYAWAAGSPAPGPDLTAQSVRLLDQIRTGGPASIDRFSHVSPLDVGKPNERAQAVRSTIEASTSLLDRQEAERFSELGIFAENEIIPFSLMARFWEATAGLSVLESAPICKRLAQLALVSQAPGIVHGLMLHGVVRDFLFHELGESKRRQLNAKLIEAIAVNLPAASPLDPAGICQTHVAWWELNKEDRYLWDHLVEHLIDAERPDDAEILAADLRWVGARLEQFGPAAPTADLAAVRSPRAARLRAALERVTHLLGATEPSCAVVDILHSRISDDPDWGLQANALRGAYPRVRLVNQWPLPDLANPSLRRVLTGTGRNGAVLALTASPDGSWLSGGGRDRKMRVWDAATGQERLALKTPPGGVMAVTGAPDGSWL
jgi:hypothetical protein